MTVRTAEATAAKMGSMTFPATVREQRLVVCIPDLPERDLIGDLPPTVEIVVAPLDPGRLPDLRQVDLVVAPARLQDAVGEALSEPGRLRVVQLLSAGVDRLIGKVPPGVTVCNARGVFDGPLAEWVVGAILAFDRGILRARDAQAERAWRRIEPSELAGTTVVILGFGSIGHAVADRLRPFGVTIVGVGRTPREGVLGLEDLDSVLPRADVLVDLLPLTRESRGLVDAHLLGRLPDGALFVNAGRGATVRTDDLLAEIERGRLSAALDVTDPEPLPPDHPLWALPNVLISPHVSGDSPEAMARGLVLAGDQIRRFAAGQPLVNRVERYLLE